MRAEKKILAVAVRAARLTAFSAALALMAGAGARVYAAAPAQDTAVPTPTAENATAAPAVQPAAAAEPVQTSAADPAAATAGTAPQALTPAVLTNGGKAKKAKKVKKKKEKPPKLTPLHVSEGTLTVDGWTGKARLNYDIADLKYIYVWAPGIGTVVASNVKFPLAQEQKNAFTLNTLTITADGHTIQISSDGRLMKSKKPISAWVYLDTSYKHHSAYPEMGYGAGKDAPYAWPGARQVTVEAGAAGAPPMPAALRPVLAKPGCSAPVAAVAGAPAVAPSAATAPCTPAARPGAAPSVPLPASTAPARAAVESTPPPTSLVEATAATSVSAPAQ